MIFFPIFFLWFFLLLHLFLGPLFIDNFFIFFYHKRSLKTLRNHIILCTIISNHSDLIKNHCFNPYQSRMHFWPSNHTSNGISVIGSCKSLLNKVKNYHSHWIELQIWSGSSISAKSLPSAMDRACGPWTIPVDHALDSWTEWPIHHAPKVIFNIF